MAELHAQPSGTSAGPARGISGRVVLVILALLIIGSVAVNVVFARRNRDSAHRSERAEQVFDDAARTTIIWLPQPDGVVQRATAQPDLNARDLADTEALIRFHMDRLLVQRRNVGDFGTLRFSGKPMAGRDDLENDAGSIKATRSDVPGGAELTFKTEKRALREALKAWVGAQVSPSPSA